MNSHTAIWRRHDLPGHDGCRLSQADGGWQIEGAAVLVYESQLCLLNYNIRCDASWVTQTAAVSGWVGERQIDVSIARSPLGEWQLNGHQVDGVSGCDDIDLNFSPSTNLLPIRRLGLSIGEHRAVRAAWLRFPSFALEPLEQIYTRLAERHYRYESAGGAFVAEVSVDELGLPLAYSDIWSRETTGQ